MQIGDTVLFYDADGTEFPVVIHALEDGSAVITVRFEEKEYTQGGKGYVLTGVPKITARNMKENDIIIGPCYDPRPKPEPKQK